MRRLRVWFWLAILLAALTATAPLSAQEAPPDRSIPAQPAEPAPESPTDTSDIPPASQPVPPDAGSAATTTSPPADEVHPLPQLPYPDTQVPSPVAPSKTNTEQAVPRPVPPLTQPEPGTEAPPTVPERPKDSITVSADDVRTTYEAGVPVVTTATGNVTARYKNMAITSERGRVDYRPNTALFEGNVVFRIDMQEVRGERLEIDLGTRAWSFLTASSTITPQFAQGLLRAPVYATGRQLEGVRTQRFSAFDTDVTTCDLATPHYDLVSRSITVYPNSKIVLRRTTFYGLGRKLFTLPRLVIPLRDVDKNPNLIPRFGQSAEEGYYLKSAFSYLGTKAQTGLLLLDLMSRKGIGTGLRHSYTFGNAIGELSYYRINDRTIDQTTRAGRLTHNQQFGTLRLSLSSDFRENSYLYAPESKSMINQLTLTRNMPGAASALSVYQTINNAFQRTANLNATLKHRQLFGEASSLDTSFDYTNFGSGGLTQARLTSLMLFSRTEKKFDWNVSAQKINDLSDEAFVGGGLFAGIERLPELALVSDTTRLGDILPFHLPARFMLSYGDYRELPANRELGRAYINIDTPIRRRRVSNTWTFAGGTNFRQYLYSDSTAQYSFDTSAALTKRLGTDSSFALTYRRQLPRGFTPFRFDFLGNYNVLNASLRLQESERFKVSLLTGYNFEQNNFPWQDIVLRFAVQPTSSLLFYTATGYDLNTSRWRTLINQIRVRAGEDFKLDIGTNYDTTRSKLGTARMQLDTKIGSKLRLQAVAGYNGFTKDFDYRSAMLTRDLHCWEASLMFVDQGGFYNNKSIMLNFRIKAFPLFDSFGMGPFGQALDTSVGQVY